MRELSLFTGAGGGLLGSLILGWRTVAAVEYEPYCQRVLCARGGYMADAEPHGRGQDGERGELASVGRGPQDDAVPAAECHSPFPVYGDIRDFDGRAWRGRCDIVTGGFPCQPFSQAGKRLGADDPRNMWPHTVRVLVESGAPLGFFENVPGLLSSGYFGTVLGDLAAAGFDAEWCVLGADDVGAPHRRKRLWILAYRDGIGLQDVPVTGRTRGETAGPGRCGHAVQCSEVSGGGAELADAASAGLERCTGTGARELFAAEGSGPWWCDPADVGDATSGRPWQSETGDGRRGAEGAGADADPWLALPYVGRVAHGVASRVDRLRALGNGQVPQAMAAAFALLARRAGI